jgi:hypothetical protein
LLPGSVQKYILIYKGITKDYLTEKQVFKLLNKIGETITKDFNGLPKIIKDLETGKTLVIMHNKYKSYIGVPIDDNKCKLPKELREYEELIEKFEETGDVSYLKQFIGVPFK